MRLFSFFNFILVITTISCQEAATDLATSDKTSTFKTDVDKDTIDQYNVGIVVVDGVYNTELTAPYDIFQHTQYREGIKPMNVFLVAPSMDVITTFEGIRLLPDYTFKNTPKIDILVVPSAEHHLDTDLENVELIDFIKDKGTGAQYVTSHCDGAFILAQAGLLEHKVSTTFPSDINAMRSRFPDLDIREDVWFVHDKNVITSAGGARSFEAAMYLCDLLYGPDITQSLASGLVLEYDLEAYPHLIID